MSMMMIYTGWKTSIYNIPLVALSHGGGDERTSSGVALLSRSVSFHDGEPEGHL